MSSEKWWHVMLHRLKCDCGHFLAFEKKSPNSVLWTVLFCFNPFFDAVNKNHQSRYWFVCFELQLPCVVPFISPGNAGVVGCGIIVYARRDRDWWLMVWRGLEDYDSRIPSGSSRINTEARGLSIHTNIYRPQRICGKVMFSQACVMNSVHSGVCMAGVHAWQGGCAWQEGACVAGWHAWQEGHAWHECPPPDTTRCGQWAGGTHPTGMHFCTRKNSSKMRTVRFGGHH